MLVSLNMRTLFSLHYVYAIIFTKWYFLDLADNSKGLNLELVNSCISAEDRTHLTFNTTWKVNSKRAITCYLISITRNIMD